MNIAILHFSARSSGNCAAIAHQLRQLHSGAEIALYPVAALDISPCCGCNCQCFTRAEACPHAHDDVRRMYQAIMDEIGRAHV